MFARDEPFLFSYDHLVHRCWPCSFASFLFCPSLLSGCIHAFGFVCICSNCTGSLTTPGAAIAVQQEAQRECSLVYSVSLFLLRVPSTSWVRAFVLLCGLRVVGALRLEPPAVQLPQLCCSMQQECAVFVALLLVIVPCLPLHMSCCLALTHGEFTLAMWFEYSILEYFDRFIGASESESRLRQRGVLLFVQ